MIDKLNIKKLAQQAGMIPISFNRTSFKNEYSAYPADLERFAELVKAAALEQAAQHCDELATHLVCHRDRDGADLCISIRDSIRDMKPC